MCVVYNRSLYLFLTYFLYLYSARWQTSDVNSDRITSDGVAAILAELNEINGYEIRLVTGDADCKRFQGNWECREIGFAWPLKTLNSCPFSWPYCSQRSLSARYDIIVDYIIYLNRLDLITLDLFIVHCDIKIVKLSWRNNEEIIISVSPPLFTAGGGITAV